VIGAVFEEIGAYGRRAQILSERLIPAAVLEQQLVRGIVLQNREAKLAPADDRERDGRRDQA